MKKIEIAQIYDYDFSVNVINVLKYLPTRIDYFNCIGNPKTCNILIYLSGCKAKYTLKNGEQINVPDGSMIYTPVNSEYIVEFYEFENDNSCTLGINFLLYDKENQPFVLNNSIEVFNADNINYSSLFESITKYGEANIICHSKIKSIMYEILFRISEYFHKDNFDKYRNISKGIIYLEQNEEQRLKINEIAKLCNVSEVYFRKLFKEYSGISPTEYRNNNKICKAKSYLKNNDLSICEISDLLGFIDVSYFIKVFKERTGITPKEYRKSFENKSRDSLF